MPADPVCLLMENIAFVVDSSQFAPARRQKFCILNRICSVTSKAEPVVYFHKKRAPILRHPEVCGISRRGAFEGFNGIGQNGRVVTEIPVAAVRAHVKDLSVPDERPPLPAEDDQFAAQDGFVGIYVPNAGDICFRTQHGASEQFVPDGLYKNGP